MSNKSEKFRVLYDFSSQDEDINAWDDFDFEPQSLFFNPKHHVGVYQLRLLGSHYVYRRTYADNCKISLNSENLRSILNGDREVAKDAINKVKTELYNKYCISISPTSTPFGLSKTEKEKYDQIERQIKYIETMLDKKRWQKCILINCYVIELKRLVIIALTSTDVANLRSSIRNKNSKINGIIAHNIISATTLSTERQNRREEYRVGRFGAQSVTSNNEFPSALTSNCSAPFVFSENSTRLEDKVIVQIVNSGLYDIPKVIKEINDININKCGGYFYKLVDNYKAPEEFFKDVKQEAVNEINKINLEKSFDNVDVSCLPKDVFDDADISSNPLLGIDDL